MLNTFTQIRELGENPKQSSYRISISLSRVTYCVFCKLYLEIGRTRNGEGGHTPLRFFATSYWGRFFCKVPKTYVHQIMGTFGS